MLDIDKTQAATVSLLGNRWKLREVDEREALALAQCLELPEFIGRMLAGRGITLEDAPAFLNPTLKDSLPDPSHLKDMDKAASRVAEAVKRGEHIGVFGDYDVDGATSSALLVRYFRALGVRCSVHIPDRQKEGYGPNSAALLALQGQGASLVITVDCGTVAFEPLARAREAGLDVIVIDHHKGETKLPEALAIVNPNRLDENSPHTHLAAVGMTFLLLVAVNRVLRQSGYFAQSTEQRGQREPLNEPDLRQWLDLVALGTVCDVVSLTGVNRAFVSQGLKVLAARGNCGLNALCDVGRVQERPGAYHLGFILGPRINAGGRVGQADLGMRLLTTEHPEEARQLAATLDRHNAERQAIEAVVLEEAMAQAGARPPDMPVILVQKEGWHEGVIGIVAGRLKEAFDKPAGVIALQDGKGKGSARSVTGVDLGAAIAQAHMEGVLLAGGGHAMAAGFAVEEAKIPVLRKMLCERLGTAVARWQGERTLSLDAQVSLGAVSPELAEILEQIGPFGMGNPQPRLWLAEVRVVKADIVGQNHVRVLLAESGVAGRACNTRLSAVAFRAAETPLGQALLNTGGKAMHVAGNLRLSEWQGRRRAEFHIVDAAWISR